MRARVTALLMFVCLTTVLAIAQGRGVMVIKVVDAAGAIIPGAAITISGPAQRTCVTNERGECAFAGLLSGQYEVKAELTGFATAVHIIDLTATRTERVNVVMRVGSVAETVTVTGSASVVETRSAARAMPAPPPAPMSPARVGGNVAGYAGGTVATEPYYRPYRGGNTESYDKIDENPFRSVSDSPLSTFSIDVDTASYANVRRFLNDGTMPPVDAVRVEELINYFDFDYPQPRGNQPFSITTELSECPWNPKHRLALVGLKGREIVEKNDLRRNLVFLIDVSGSMDSPDKLPLVKHGLRMLADTLTANDTLAIVVYAGNSGLTLPATPGNRKERIDRAIVGLTAGGSTNGGAGIRLAYEIARENFVKGGVNRVVLATDGDFNVGVTSDEELVKLIERERESGVFLSVLGVGTGNLQDSKMEKLADKGNGNYSYLDTLNEAHRVLVKEASSTLVTIAKDVKIQIEFNPRAVNAYRLIGYENRLLRDQDFNDDRKDAGEIGAGHSVTAIYEIVPAGTDLDRPRVDALKYADAPAPPATVAKGKYDGELLTVKLRHKAPDGDASELTSAVIADRPQPLAANLGFASAVAESGMLLRRSPQAGNASFANAIARARKFRGDDPEGYRAEFIRLMEMASTLAKRDPSTR
jgi:Ca-activated chloride channel homolog